MKKIRMFLLSCSLLLALGGCASGGGRDPFDSGSDVVISGDVLEFAAKLKCGWNLGNTLDATDGSGLGSETSWGQPETTKAMIDAVADAGFRTIRIPVSWSNHITDQSYTIDSAWMKRVKQVVDWAIEDGLYVILNCHHDNYESNTPVPKCGGYYPSTLNWNESMLFVRNVWRQIGGAFKDYDEHLIFETLNEPRLRGHEHEWWYNKSCTTCKDGAANVNKLNQTALDTIRASGGNNASRFVMVTGLAASIGSYQADDSWKLPADSAEGRLLLSVHMYSPYSFALESPGETVFTENHRKELAYNFSWLNDRFVQKGVPVIIGEYGATNKGNLDERVKWFSYFVSESGKYGMVTCLWDNGASEPSQTEGERFGFFDRAELGWYFPEIISAIMGAAGAAE